MPSNFCSVLGRPTTQIFERLETPPPIPFSCLPYSGSGEPIIPRKMVSQSERSAGRCFSCKNIPFDVPPRRKVAGIGFGVCIPLFPAVMNELYFCVARAIWLRIVWVIAFDERYCVPMYRHAETPIYRMVDQE